MTEKLLHYRGVYYSPWFDPETGTLMLREYVVEMDSYRRIFDDQAVADAELDAQTQRVTSLLRQLEEALSSEAAAVATEALCELAVLNAIQVKCLQAASLLPHSQGGPSSRLWQEAAPEIPAKTRTLKGGA